MNEFIEKQLFIFVNIIFSFSLLIFWVFEQINSKISIELYAADYITSENDFVFIFLSLLFVVFIITIKIFLFPIIYKFKNFFPYTYKILENFKKKKHYRKDILKNILFLDIITFIISLCFTFLFVFKIYTDLFLMIIYLFFIYLILGGGALISYLLFLFFLKLHSLINKKQYLFCKHKI